MARFLYTIAHRHKTVAIQLARCVENNSPIVAAKDLERVNARNAFLAPAFVEQCIA